MDKKKILETLEQLTHEFNKSEREKKNEILLTIEKMIKNYLSYYPHDIDMLFKLSRVADYQNDDEAAIEYLNTILSYEPTNAYALLTIASIQHEYPIIDDNVFERLCAFKTDDLQIQSMLEYMKSRYYSTKSSSEGNNEIMEEHHLKKSIELCDTFVWNYQDLAWIYIKKGELSAAQDLLIKALFNIKSVSAEHDYWDFLSPKVYINELVTGIWINNIQYKHILATLCNFTLDRS